MVAPHSHHVSWQLPVEGGRTNLPSMRMLHLGLRVSDLEQSLALYNALGYAKLGSVPQREFGNLTMLQASG